MISVWVVSVIALVAYILRRLFDVPLIAGTGLRRERAAVVLVCCWHRW